MRRFWDRRAREDAFYFVDNRLRYRDPNLDEFWAGGREVMDILASNLGVRVEPTDTTLDIGCGVGRITRVLSESAEKVLALDVSPEMLDRARELNPDCDNVEWLLGDGTSLTGVPDAAVDACVSQVVLQHIPDPAVTLGYVREIGRVLRPGGWAAIQVSNNPSIHRARSSIGRRLSAALGRAPRGQSHQAWLGSSVDLDELRAAAQEGGLDVEQIQGEGTLFCQVVLRKAVP
jgi:SAM-dependent methyltransferase